MVKDYQIIYDILSPLELLRIRNASRMVRYIPVKMDSANSLFIGKLPGYFNRALTTSMEEACGAQLKDLGSFFRLNSERHDTSFRIHSDTEIGGHRPTHAAVFYLETAEESGTALYRHPVYGDRNLTEPSVFDKDDGNWERYMTCHEVENSMFIYKAELFHGRYPWRARGNTRKDGRIVVVKFMKEVK